MSFLSLPYSAHPGRGQTGGGFISNLGDPIKEGGEELDARAGALPKQLPLRVPLSTGLSPNTNSTNRAFQRHPKTGISPWEGETPTALERPGSAGCCREERVSKGKPAGLEGSEWWPFHLGVTPVSGRNKTSLEQGAAVSPRLVNGLRINFLFTQ